LRSDPELAVHEVDIRPAKAEGLADVEAGEAEHGDDRPKAGARMGDERRELAR